MIIALIKGVYQLKSARSYAEERSSTIDLTRSVNYTIHRCKEFPHLIRAPTQSRHKNRVIYNPTIQFIPQEILQWWCDCPTGNGLIGCCSHVVSLIWFLSYERWQVDKRRMPSGDFINLAADANQLSDFYDTTDDDTT
jgi:hypothetical protein